MKFSKIAQAKNIRGQGMSEYVIIVALIAVAAIAVTGLFGGAARNQFAGIASELSGGDATASVTAAAKDATSANTEAATVRGMSNYAGSNSRAK